MHIHCMRVLIVRNLNENVVHRMCPGHILSCRVRHTNAFKCCFVLFRKLRVCVVRVHLQQLTGQIGNLGRNHEQDEQCHKVNDRHRGSTRRLILSRIERQHSVDLRGITSQPYSAKIVLQFSSVAYLLCLFEHFFYPRQFWQFWFLYGTTRFLWLEFVFRNVGSMWGCISITVLRGITYRRIEFFCGDLLAIFNTLGHPDS
jgi:hypothetical protein